MSHTTTFKDYCRVLTHNSSYRLAFISYCIDNVGNWLTFVACIAITSKVGGSLYTSAYLITRLLPSFLFAGLIGPLADKWDKRWLMIGCALGSASSVSILLIPAHDDTLLWMVFLSASMQFTFAAMYEPVRNSLIPLITAPEDLPAATTLDSMGWSTVGALGAAIGGAVNSMLGNRASFLIDLISYILCAMLIYCIPVETGIPTVAPSALMTLPGTVEMTEPDNCTDDTVGLLEKGEEGHFEEGGVALTKTALPEAASGDTACPKQLDSGSFSDSLSYVISRPNVLCLVGMKGSGALAWGAADILAVKFSEMKRNQSLGDADMTLGLTFAMVGLGCQVGPMLWNAFLSPGEKALFQAVVLAFAKMTLSYLITVFAPDIYSFLFAIFLRCMGSAVVWVYSTLLIQTIVPSGVQGRVFAIERALYVICEMSSVLLRGYVFAEWNMGVRRVCLMMTIVSAVLFVIWTALYLSNYRQIQK